MTAPANHDAPDQGRPGNGRADDRGADDERLVMLLDEYTEAAQRGEIELCRRLLSQHPELVRWAACVDLLDDFAGNLPGAPHLLGESRFENSIDRGSEFSRRIVREFGKFELIEEIGRGGMGVVYQARQKDLDRTIALKMILANRLAAESDVKRFLREARAAGGLRHPNIVAIHEVGEIHGQHYFTMDLISGKSLSRVAAAGALPSEEAARLAMQVAQAVQFLHDHGILHRDLKPSNILIDETGNAFVSDFGLAKVFDDPDERTLSGTTLGTPAYMPPEQASGKMTQISERSDVYGIGAVLYELLTGRPPFRDDSPHRTILQVLESDPVLPRQWNSRVPRELERICLKCLEKDPLRRYATASTVADDLDRFLRREPIEAREAGPIDYVRRWLRRESGLASRFSIMLTAVFVTQAEHLLHDRPWSYHWKIKLAFIVWALLTFVFQRLLRRERTEPLARLGWALTDPFFLLYILMQAERMETLLIGYPVIIVTSGLWFRERLVYVSTASCLASYGVLLLIRRETIELVHYPIIFAWGLTLIGAVIAYQVQRVRTLNRYFEQTKPSKSTSVSPMNSKRQK